MSHDTRIIVRYRRYDTIVVALKKTNKQKVWVLTTIHLAVSSRFSCGLSSVFLCSAFDGLGVGFNDDTRHNRRTIQDTIVGSDTGKQIYDKSACLATQSSTGVLPVVFHFRPIRRSGSMIRRYDTQSSWPADTLVINVHNLALKGSA